MIDVKETDVGDKYIKYTAAKVFGEEDPKFVALMAGLVSGDNFVVTFGREEGEDVGAYGPYKQSERTEIYQTYIKLIHGYKIENIY